ATIASEVHEPLDRHRDFAAQVALHCELLHILAQPVELGIGEVLDFAGPLHACRNADGMGACAPDTIDRRERDIRVLVVGDVDACDACHVVPAKGNLKLYQYEQGLINHSALALLVPRVGADHADHALAAHDLAFAANSLD